MQTSPDGRHLIEAFEGLFLHSYYDSVHVLTIGYGHTNLGGIPPHVNVGDVWTREQCDTALSNDLARFDGDVDRVIGRCLTQQYQHDALASFDFNTGSLAKSSIPSKIAAGNMQAAAATLLQYNHAGGRVLAGLTRRRQAEAAMLLGNLARADELAGIHGNTTDEMAKASPGPTGETKTPEQGPGLEALIKFIIGLT